MLYISAFRAIYNSLNIHTGSYRDPYYGMNGYIGLDDAYTIRECFPTRGELIAFENIIIQDALSTYVEHGNVVARQELNSEYGFTDAEIDRTMKLARKHAAKIVNTDPDEEKNVMILRLEDTIRRTRQSFDVRNELKAIEILSKIIGITRAEPNDFNSEAANHIRNWTDSSSAEIIQNRHAAIPSHVVKTLPAPAEVPSFTQ